MAVTRNYEAMAATGRSTASGTGVDRRGGVIVRMMPKDDPRESHGSLMMLRRAIRVVRLSNLYVMTRRSVSTAGMEMTRATATVMIRVVCAAVVVIVVVVVLLLRLTLTVLLILHTTILKPYLNLSLRESQISSQFPTFLFRHVSVVEKFFLELEGLVLGVGLAFLPNRHLTRPFQWIRSTATHTHPGNTHTNADARQRTCGKQGRWGGTPHHLTQLVCRLLVFLHYSIFFLSYKYCNLW